MVTPAGGQTPLPGQLEPGGPLLTAAQLLADMSAPNRIRTVEKHHAGDVKQR